MVKRASPRHALARAHAVSLVSLVGCAAALVLPACPLRGPEDLLDDVNARLVVLDVDARGVVDVDVAGEARRSEPRAQRANIELEFVLPEGVHAGTVTVLRTDDDGGDDDDDDDDDDGEGGDDGLEADRCGTFTFEVEGGSIDIVVLDANELSECDDDEGEEGEGEGDEGEGEGEGTEGEGEGGEGEGEGDEGEGEGEGEGGDAECGTLIERFDDAELDDDLALSISGDASAVFVGTLRIDGTGDGEPGEEPGEVRIERSWSGAPLRVSVVLLEASAADVAAAFLALENEGQEARLVIEPSATGDVIAARFNDDGAVTRPLVLPAVLALSVDGEGNVQWQAGPLGAEEVLREEQVPAFDEGEISVGAVVGAGGTCALDDFIVEETCPSS